MSRNRRSLEGLVRQYIQGQGDSDLDNNRTLNQFMLYGKEALRKLQFDTINVVKSVNIPINKTLNIVEFPEDYVDWVRIGVVDNCRVYSLGRNDRINFSGNYLLDNTNQPLLDADGVELLDDVECVSSRSGSVVSGNTNDIYYNTGRGRQFGAVGGFNRIGEYRLNFMDNRIQLSSNLAYDKIVLEYAADETMLSNPLVHVFAEEAVLAYIFWRAIKRKGNVASNRIQMAEREFVLAKKKARAHFLAFTKEEAIQTHQKGFSQVPRIPSSS